MGSQGSKAAGQMSAAAVQARRAAAAQAAKAEAQHQAAAAAAAARPPQRQAAAAAAAAAVDAPSPPAAAAAAAGPGDAQVPASVPPAAPPAPAGGGGGAVGASRLLETDADLIKAMNELGPAIKTMRLETPRVAQNRMVHAHDERAHTVTEETLAKILTARRDNPRAFAAGTMCEIHGLEQADLEKALKVLEVPRIVERQGQKFGYWN